MLGCPVGRAAAFVLVASSAYLAAACKGSPTPTQSRGSPTAASAGVPAPTDAQVGSQAPRGAGLFAQSCAKCHGAAGEGSAQAPALIGTGALPTNPPAGRRLRTGAFSTAKDIGMFVKDRMPPGGQTPPDQTAAILTFLLQSNGVRTNGDMNPSTAASIPWQR